MNKPKIIQAKQRRIVCAAVKFDKATISGVRHYSMDMNATLILLEQAGVVLKEEAQGFLDNRGTFLTREEAWDVALHAGQILHHVHGRDGVLYSEHLY